MLKPPGLLFLGFAAALLAALHAGAFAAFFHFEAGFFLAALLLWQATGILGVSVGYHRLLNHRSFECPRPIKWVLLFLAGLAGQLGPIRWVRVHRFHHAHSDTDLDPHTPRRGFWFAHLAWLFQAGRRGNEPALQEPPADLLADPDCRFFERAYPFLFYGSLAAIGWGWGWAGFLWLGTFRLAVTLHSILSINSVGHVFGRRDFDLPDDSRNLRLWAAFTGGEALHNNHHAHPRSARFACRPWEPDAGWLAIRSLAALGLAWNVRYYDPVTGSLAILRPRPQSIPLPSPAGT
ncbi:MAG: acyl-CoA desaturase [Fibrobacteres bacterium]|nr:acyl-CoA desaturase [Fibrobacterota bacterium]